MTQAEFTGLLQEKIDNASHAERVDFSLAICDELLPEYILFAKHEDFGNVPLMEEAINFCKLNRNVEPEDLSVNIDLDELEENIPDVDDFEDFDGSTAMNASCAIFELLEYLSDRETYHIINIGNYMTDTVEFRLGSTDPTLTSSELDNHPLVFEERKRLLALI